MEQVIIRFQIWEYEEYKSGNLRCKHGMSTNMKSKKAADVGDVERLLVKENISRSNHLIKS